jgi:hypothetical protein
MTFSVLVKRWSTVCGWSRPPAEPNQSQAVDDVREPHAKPISAAHASAPRSAGRSRLSRTRVWPRARPPIGRPGRLELEASKPG